MLIDLETNKSNDNNNSSYVHPKVDLSYQTTVNHTYIKISI